jgi:hypothetical protein
MLHKLRVADEALHDVSNHWDECGHCTSLAINTRTHTHNGSFVGGKGKGKGKGKGLTLFTIVMVLTPWRPWDATTLSSGCACMAATTSGTTGLWANGNRGDTPHQSTLHSRRHLNATRTSCASHAPKSKPPPPTHTHSTSISQQGVQTFPYVGSFAGDMRERRAMGICVCGGDQLSGPPGKGLPCESVGPRIHTGPATSPASSTGRCGLEGPG